MRGLKVWGLCGFFALAVSAFAAKGEQVLLRLPLKATVAGPKFTLGEVAEIITSDKTLVEKVGRMDLGKAAPLGETFRLSQGAIKIVLRRLGYNLDQFTFEGPEATEVLTQAQEFDLNGLLPDLKAFLVEALKEQPENVQVTLMNLDKKLHLPAGEVRAKFRKPVTDRFEGPLLLTAELEVDSHLVKVVPLRAVVEVLRPVLVAKGHVDKGQILTEDKVGLKRLPTSRIPPDALKDLKGVVGHKAALPLEQGAVVRVVSVEDPPVIHRGATIMAVVTRGNIEITVSVRALANGKAGEVIQVENTESHKVLRARVLDEKTVLVEEQKP